MSLKYTVNKVNFIEPSSNEYPRIITLLAECVFTGIATLIFGKIILDLFDSKNPFNFSNKLIGNYEINKKECKKRNKMFMAFFASGFIIHLIIELMGLNCYFCSKQCLKNISNFVENNT